MSRRDRLRKASKGTKGEARFAKLASPDLDKSEVNNNSTPHLTLAYYDSGYECFSDWDKKELRDFSNFCKKLQNTTWQQVYQSGGKRGGKTGLGYTPHEDRTKLL